MSNNSQGQFHTNELLRVGSYTTDDILIKWELDECDKLLLIGTCFSDDDKRLTFYSAIMGIYESLHAIFASAEQANSWIKRANTHYDGLSALQYMQSGGIEAILEVRHYLSTQHEPFYDRLSNDQ
jgi:hypothetical protein